jgi:hypothetical protein
LRHPSEEGFVIPVVARDVEHAAGDEGDEDAPGFRGVESDRFGGRLSGDGAMLHDEEHDRYPAHSPFPHRAAAAFLAISARRSGVSFVLDRLAMRAVYHVPPTPAMAAGVAAHVWRIEEIVALIEARESADSN